MKKCIIILCLILIFVNCNLNIATAKPLNYYDVLAEICGETPKLFTEKVFTQSELDYLQNLDSDDIEKIYNNFPECDGIYHYALFDLDNDGIQELIFSYAKAEFLFPMSSLTPRAALYIYTMNNGKPMKIYENNDIIPNVYDYDSGWNLGISTIGNKNYVIISKYVYEGGSTADYLILEKDNNTVNTKNYLHSYSQDESTGYLDTNKINYTIQKNGVDTEVSESEFMNEAEKYMHYAGRGINGEGYGGQAAYMFGTKISKLDDISALDELKNTALGSKITVILNGSELSFEQPPYVENGTTMVPMRAIFESLGATIDYDASTKKITARKSNKLIELVTDSDLAMVNGKTMQLSITVKNKGGSTMVPLRFVSEALGADVEWDDANKTIYIYSITDEDILQSARQMLGNVVVDNKEILYNDDKLLYKSMYKKMYIDNLSGHIVDKFAKYITDNEADEDKYMEILTTLLTISDMEFNSAVYNQSKFDSNKSFVDYAYDVYDIISGTISPESQSKSKAVKQALDLAKETAQITTDSIKKAEVINNIGDSTEHKLEILNAIYSNTSDEELKSAVIKVKQGLSGSVMLELDIVNNASIDLSEYVGNEIVLKEMMFPLLKESNIYKSDDTVKFFVDNSSEVFEKAVDGLGAFSTGAKLGLFV